MFRDSTGGSGLNLPQPVKGMLCNKKNEKYKQLIQQMTPDDLHPGIHSLLTDLKKRRIPVGLASVNENAMLILERLKIGRLFQAIADPKNIRMGKPDPEIYLQVTEMLGISPDCCVAIEDTAEGIAAIKAAGMRSVGAGSPSLKESAELWFPSTAELHVEKLVQLFE